MSDFFLNLSRSNIARKVVKKSGLPIPLPQVLKRSRGPWSHESLSGRVVAFNEDSQNTRDEISGILKDAGAVLSTGTEQLNGLVFDARRMDTPESLSQLYAFFHERIGRLTPCAHLVIVGNQWTTSKMDLDESKKIAVQSALTGFVRSLAKELGIKGITVNLIQSCNGSTLGGILRYFLSDHSSYVTGQVIGLSGDQQTSLRFEKLLQGRTILVTGAAQGIGAAITRRIAAEGANVLLLDRPQEITALEGLAREVDGIALPIDLLRDDAAVQTVKRLQEMAPIHGVVHNAGITRDKTLFKMKSEQWESVLNLNYAIPVAITELMTSKEHDYLCAKNASFVYLSSVGGIAGNPGQTNYAASKAALIGYVKAKSQFSAANPSRFNCVAPGFIETRMTGAMPLAVREVARRLNSLKQGGEPDDVAQAVAFLLSDAASSINGETLRVCGQNLIGR